MLLLRLLYTEAKEKSPYFVPERPASHFPIFYVMFYLKFELFFDSYGETYYSFCIYLHDLLSAFPTIQIMNLISHKAFQQLDVKVYFQSTLSAATGNTHYTVQLGNGN